MKQAAFALLMVLAMGAFLWLGIWQVERREWKLELIRQTEQKLAAAAVGAPAPEAWGNLNSGDAYTKVTVRGSWLAGKDTFVVASTRYGRGFWVMTPLKTDAGFVVLVNRGFVTSQQKAILTTPEGVVAVEGLLRLSEPAGSLLQGNDAAVDRWYSRDVAAIAARRGIQDVAPYFVDAGDTGAVLPKGGLTVVQFKNNHLQYALTWFGLALLSALSLIVIFRKPRQPYCIQ